MWWLAALAACTPTDDPTRPVGPAPTEFPAADAYDPPEGPGAPARSFSDDELFEPCGYVLGGPGDAEHHNLLVMHDGWLVHPWAPEDGGGGISFFDVTDPCAPVLHGQGWADGMRETHTLAFGEADGREYLAVDYLSPDDPATGGVGFWDITDRSAPEWVSELATPQFYYPDSYLRVTFANFWQGSVLYVAAAFNGIHVVDVSDPLNPELVTTYDFSPPHLVGSVTVVGNVLMAASAGTQRVILMDVSDPFDPQPIPGGTFDTVDADGTVRKYYFSSWSGPYGLFARGDRGGGPIVYDLSDPTDPRWVSDHPTPDNDGGYVYRQGDWLFQGDSEQFTFYDVADITAPELVATLELPGDLDTMSPIGNVAVLSVDSGAPEGQASTVVPFQREPDTDPPDVGLVIPGDGATLQALTSRIGVSFDEWVERATVFEGSFRVVDSQLQQVPGTFNVQENVVNFTPDAALLPGETYTVTLPAGGIADYSGNAMQDELTWSFTTGEGR